MSAKGKESSKEGHGLTPEELDELEQCKKIIALRDRVAAGLHPTIKSLHLRKLFGLPNGTDEIQSPAYDKHIGFINVIDMSFNYYQVLGLSGNPTQQDIDTRFQEMRAAHYPDDENNAARIARLDKGQQSKKQSVRRMAFRYWASICKARHILADENLRAEYDGRFRATTDTNKATETTVVTKKGKHPCTLQKTRQVMRSEVKVKQEKKEDEDEKKVQLGTATQPSRKQGHKGKGKKKGKGQKAKANK
ncbi:hypothetical protein PVAG01_05204 [Phlyctema vagabunda]|uniref:J domain-containing protein n=1 Tax=Phlyctema vagabunda TaxID=108571 RepID=A0ABR4PK47_9HELO